MATSLEENNSESVLVEDDFIWECQTNEDPWDAKQRAEWTPYPSNKSSAIEQAHIQRLKELMIDENYRIDLTNPRQQHIYDPYRQRPIRRRRIRFPPNVSINEETGEKLGQSERLSSPLGLASSASVTGDTKQYGSSFIQNSFYLFTKGTLKYSFDTIFHILLQGLIEEGKNETPEKLQQIESALTEVQRNTHGKSSKNKMEALESCCANLYTKSSYIYRAVNNALRDNDETKFGTLGPFAFVLFNFIGQQSKDNSSIRDRLKRKLHSSKTQSIILYRGDRNCGDTVEEYRQSVGNHSKYFKWLQFVSTSRNKKVAEAFRGDMLYTIEIESYSSNVDQLTDMTVYSDFPEEEEILLLPGVQFQVKKVDFDNEKGRHLINIIINSSYIHKLI